MGVQCAYKYFSHVRFCWTTGISNLVSPPAPDPQKPWKEEQQTVSCNTQSPCVVPLLLSPTLRSSDFGLAREEPIGTIWSILLLPRIIMQSVTFLWFLMSFLHWTTKSLCRRGEGSFKCEKDAWCAHSIESFVRDNLDIIFRIFSLCKNDRHTVHLPPTVKSTKKLLSLHRHCLVVHKAGQNLRSALPTTSFFYKKVGNSCSWSGDGALPAWIWYNLCKPYCYCHNLPTLYPFSPVESTAVVGRCEL